MTKILITGAAGFIGSHTTELLLEQGHEVVGVDNLRTGKAENLKKALTSPRFRFYQSDICQSNSINEIIEAHRPDSILHLAALVSVPESIKHPELNRRLNVDSTCILSSAAAKYDVRRIVFASSAAVYGRCQNLPLVESERCIPVSPYGEAKLESEAILAQYASSGAGRGAVALRYFNVYGRRQDPSSPYSGVISLFCSAARKGLHADIFGDGHQTRDFVHVSDVARANSLALASGRGGFEVYNVCTGCPVSLNRLIQVIQELYNRNIEIRHKPPREGDIRHSLGRLEDARRMLDFYPRHNVESGLREMMECSGAGQA